MSIISFSQDEQTLAGLSVFDAPEEWSLEAPQPSEDLIYPVLTSENGPGSWLIFNPSRSVWATLLRSGDTPYNDCLPPSETLLLEVLQENETVESVLKSLYQTVEDRFLNAFFCVVGNVDDNDLYWFEGSVQPDHGKLEPGRHFLRDNAEPEDGEGPAGLTVGSNESLDDLEETVETTLESEACEKLLARDGMRSTECVVLFWWNEKGLLLSYNADFPPRSDWIRIDASNPVRG